MFQYCSMRLRVSVGMYWCNGTITVNARRVSPAHIHRIPMAIWMPSCHRHMQATVSAAIDLLLVLLTTRSFTYSLEVKSANLFFLPP